MAQKVEVKCSGLDGVAVTAGEAVLEVQVALRPVKRPTLSPRAFESVLSYQRQKLVERPTSTFSVPQQPVEVLFRRFAFTGVGAVYDLSKGPELNKQGGPRPYGALWRPNREIQEQGMGHHESGSGCRKPARFKSRKLVVDKAVLMTSISLFIEGVVVYFMARP